MVLDQVEAEQDALETSQTALAELLDACDEPQVTARYQPEIEDSLDELAKDRQETLTSRPSTARADGHDLCAYLYQKFDWTYPVLTALALFRHILV
jgi:hypothetical protein